MSSNVIKTCACGRSFTQEQWNALPSRGFQTFDWGEKQELRNCSCGSTIVLVLERGQAVDPIPGALWRRHDGEVVRIQEVTGHPVVVFFNLPSGHVRGSSILQFFRDFEPVPEKIAHIAEALGASRVVSVKAQWPVDPNLPKRIQSELDRRDQALEDKFDLEKEGG